MTSDRDPIVVTGAGLVTALGTTREATWRAIRTGACGIGPLTALEQTLDPPARGGEAPPLETDANADGERPNDRPREVRYLRAAIDEALHDAAIDVYPEPDRCAVVLGTTLAGMRSGGLYLRSGDPAALKTFLAGATMQSALDGLPFTGPALNTCAACASGLASIAIGAAMLERGDVDLVIAGGYDPVSEYVYAGFNSLRLIAPDPPQPFSAHRTGMNLGEGYAITILERASSARARNARTLARILGIGESTDAFHLTQPHPDGTGASRAILDALRAAGLAPADVDLISAHATATPHNDAAEFAAYQQVFGDDLPAIPVVAFKSHLGHTLGGAGTVELILAMLAMRDGVLPPVASVTRSAIEFPGLDLVTDDPRPATPRRAIGLSLGFGGTNSCIAIETGASTPPTQSSPTASTSAVAAPAAHSSRASDTNHRVCITGIGIIAPGCIGRDALRDRLLQTATESNLPAPADTGPIDEADMLPLFASARRVRRFSAFVKQMLAASTLALDDAAPASRDDFTADCPLILGSTHGSVAYTEDYYRQVVEEGIAAANPMLFAEGVPNVASAQLSMMLGTRSGAQTIIGTRTAGLDALNLAAQRIAAGAADRIIVGAAEEYSEIVNAVYGAFGLYAGDRASYAFDGNTGFATTAAAVAVVIESERAVEQRGGRAHAYIDGSAMRRAMRGDRDQLGRAIERALRAVGSPGAVMSSACGTWIDALECDAIAAAASADRATVVSAMYGHLAECFSVTPLAALCAVIAQNGLPPLYRTAPLAAPLPAPLTSAVPTIPAPDSDHAAGPIAILCTDPLGLTTATRITLR